MSTTTNYNAKFVRRADRVMLVLAVLFSGVLIFAGANANAGANATPVIVKESGIGTAHSITHEGAPGGSLSTDVSVDNAHVNISTSGGTLGN